MHTHTYPNGDTYQGLLVKNKRTSHGIYKYAKSGSKYSGFYENGLKNGYGTFLIKEGELYLGSFKNDLKDGKGIYISKTHLIFGEFLKDQLSGLGLKIRLFGDKKMVFGNFDKGKLIESKELTEKSIYNFQDESFFNDKHELIYDNKKLTEPHLYDIFNKKNYKPIQLKIIFLVDLDMNLDKLLSNKNKGNVVSNNEALKEKSNFQESNTEKNEKIDLIQSQIIEKQQIFDKENLNFERVETDQKESSSPLQKAKLENQDEFIGISTLNTESDKINGFGTYKFNSLDHEFRGNVSEGNLQYGKYQFKSGQEFKGDFDNNKINGEGTLQTKDGKTKYIGQFLNNLMHGTGKYYFHNKRNHVYIGEFKNNKPNGKGKMIVETTNQVVFDGYFVDNKKQGYGEYFADNGEIYKGKWENNAKHGVGEYFFKNGNKWKGNWIKNEPVDDDNGIWFQNEKENKSYKGKFNKTGVPN